MVDTVKELKNNFEEQVLLTGRANLITLIKSLSV